MIVENQKDLYDIKLEYPYVEDVYMCQLISLIRL